MDLSSLSRNLLKSEFICTIFRVSGDNLTSNNDSNYVKKRKEVSKLKHLGEPFRIIRSNYPKEFMASIFMTF